MLNYLQQNKEVLHPKSRLQKGSQILTVLRLNLRGCKLKGLKVLDLGCSSGIITSYLARYFGQVTGIDNDAFAISLAKKNFKQKNLKFFKMDATKFSFPNNSFDLVICHQLYSDVKSPEKLFDHIYRVLKPGRICFLAAANKFQLWDNRYHLPFFTFLPESFSKLILKVLKKEKSFMLGSYRSYWQLEALCYQFKVTKITPQILKNPKMFRFTKLYPFEAVFKLIPNPLWKALEPFSPNFIWLLKKP